MKKIIKKHYKIVIGVIIGLIISIPVVYAAQTVLSGDEISYNNGTSHGISDNVQGAIDELYKKINSYKEYIPNGNPNRNIVKAYKYDEDSNSSTYCVTGEEEKCFMTSCYDNKAKDSCPPGTIIEYKVNDSDTIRFHVVHDDGEILTLQSQKNIVYTTAWNSNGKRSEGPLTILSALEEKTNNWTNVNYLDYSIGDESSTLGYSECGYYTNTADCKDKSYEMVKNSVRSRMITGQEIISFGCNGSNNRCPIWIRNYLSNSESNGGTKNDTTVESNFGYFTMSTYLNMEQATAIVMTSKILGWSEVAFKDYYGARAVVEISK